jgi:hypothetical protein
VLGFATAVDARTELGSRASGATQGRAPTGEEKRRRDTGSPRVGDVGVVVTSVGEQLVKSRRRGELLRRRLLRLLFWLDRGQRSSGHGRLRLLDNPTSSSRCGGEVRASLPSPFLLLLSSFVPSPGGELRNQRRKTPIERWLARGVPRQGL